MALRMVALNRTHDGRWFARKVIPEDVRDDYAKLHKARREAHLKLPADIPKHEAKAGLGEWTGEVETRIAIACPEERGRAAAHKAQRDCARRSLVQLARQQAR